MWSSAFKMSKVGGNYKTCYLKNILDLLVLNVKEHLRNTFLKFYILKKLNTFIFH